MALASQRDRDLAALVNAPDRADARRKMLAFVRAQILWNEYKLDPAWMLHLMEIYQAPFDWRQAFPHGLYWTTFGLHARGDAESDDYYLAINTERIAMFCLRTLCWRGRMIYEESPDRPDAPRLMFLADLRFIDVTQQEYLRAIDRVIAATADQGPEADTRQRNVYRNGHLAFLRGAIATLFIAGRVDQARQLHDWALYTYFPTGPEWSMDLNEFVLHWLNEPGRLTPEVALAQVDAGLIRAMTALARGDRPGFNAAYDYALNTVYRAYQQRAVGDVRFRDPFERHALEIVRAMLVWPETLGVTLDLTERSVLYRSVEGVLPGIQAALYESIGPQLQKACEAEGVDFDTAFPEPARPSPTE